MTSKTVEVGDIAPDWPAIIAVVLGVTAFSVAQGLTYPLISLSLEGRGVSAATIGLNAMGFAAGLAAATLLLGHLTRLASADKLIIASLCGCSLCLATLAVHLLASGLVHRPLRARLLRQYGLHAGRSLAQHRLPGPAARPGIRPLRRRHVRRLCRRAAGDPASRHQRRARLCVAGDLYRARRLPHRPSDDGRADAAGAIFDARSVRVLPARADPDPDGADVRLCRYCGDLGDAGLFRQVRPQSGLRGVERDGACGADGTGAALHWCLARQVAASAGGDYCSRGGGNRLSRHSVGDVGTAACWRCSR